MHRLAKQTSGIECVISVFNQQSLRTIFLSTRCLAHPKRKVEDEETASSKADISENADMDINMEKTKSEIAVKAPEPMPTVHEAEKDVGFWQSERGLKIKDQTMTGVGRVLRSWISKDKYNNLYEAALWKERKKVEKFNTYDKMTLEKHGPEWAFGQLVLSVGGALKILYDDRWVDDPRHLRTPKKRDFRIEALDLRKSAINCSGLVHLAGLRHVRYLNVGDAQHFDDYSLAALHPISDTLEYLDVSGTDLTDGAFGYIRLFPRLRYLNVSRLKRFEDFDGLLPLLEEILPEHCCVITDDFEPADSYGCEIPFRSSKNPKRDKPVPPEYKNIGNLLTFDDQIGNEVDFYRHDTVHELWRTPMIGPLRHYLLKGQQDLDNTNLHSLVKYILKAEKYKPLL